MPPELRVAVPEISLAPAKSVAKKRSRKKHPVERPKEENAIQQHPPAREDSKASKASRARRQILTMEYERQITELVEDNKRLEEQVEELNKRMSVLFGLLTVHLKPKPGHGECSSPTRWAPKGATMQSGVGIDVAASAGSSMDPSGESLRWPGGGEATQRFGEMIPAPYKAAKVEAIASGVSIEPQVERAAARHRRSLASKKPRRHSEREGQFR